MKPSPCDPKCPERSITCHCTCEKYLGWVAEKEAEKKAAHSEVNCYAIEQKTKHETRRLRNPKKYGKGNPKNAPQ